MSENTSSSAAPARLVVSVPGDTLLNRLTPVPDGVDVIVWDVSGTPPRDHIDIIVPPYMGSVDSLAPLAHVTSQLVQSQSIGYDGVADILPDGITFANAATVHETATAELTVALILAALREIPRFVRGASRGQWDPARATGLADKRVLLVGYGGVGAAIADRLDPFEVTITRVASRERDDDRGHVYALSSLDELLPDADVVVLGVPLTDDTRHLADDAFFSRMHDGALFVNIARGPVADTAALLAHTSNGRLNAALDVTDPEPLPDGHPLFALPNVLISPHVGGATDAMLPRMEKLLRRQIDHLLAGDEPENVVLRT